MIPVFLGGCDRSGTTFLGSLLGGHDGCLTVPEFQAKADLLRVIGGGQHPLAVHEAMATLRNNWRFRIWNLPTEAVSSKLSDTSLATPPRTIIEAVVAAYGETQGKYVDSTRYWIDHTPSNMKDSSTLLKTFPEARFIHIVRDGRAVAASVMPLSWGPHTPDRAAQWWLQRMAFGLANEIALSSEQILRIKYEDLVLETTAMLEEICAFLGLDYQPHMAQGHGFQVPEYTRSQHALVGHQPRAERVAAWKETLSARDIEIFEGIAGGLLETLGYDLVYAGTAHSPTLPERLKFGLVEFFHSHITSRIRHKKRLAAINHTADALSDE